MTNRIALVLALAVVAVFATDAWAFDGALSVFLGRKGLEFLEWMAFWR